LMAQLSRWLERSTLDAGELTVQQVEQFRRENRAQGHRFPKSAKGFVPILEYLRAVGAVPVAPARIPTTSEELVGRFGLYLVGERGLAAGTIRGYQDAARLFLADVGFTKERDLALLAPTQVHRFLLAESARRSVASVKCLVSGLKALLCFLYLQGITGASLAGSVPTVAGWSGSSVPRGVDAGCVRRLLNSCDRRSTKGRRDYAILMVLVRLGIRAGEVVALELNDVDWRRGELLIRGKARRLEQLPIPVDVGQAMADYVRRGRPVSEHRGLFLRVLAPHRGLTVGAISVIVHAACDRAGVGFPSYRGGIALRRRR
jgi:site-specific recombinase XerD